MTGVIAGNADDHAINCPATKREQHRGHLLGRPGSVAPAHAKSLLECVEVGPALAGNLAQAIWHIAEPASAVYSQTYGVAAPTQIERPSEITAVRTSADFAALRAWNSPARWLCNKDETSVVLDNDQDDAPLLLSPPSPTIGTHLRCRR